MSSHVMPRSNDRSFLVSVVALMLSTQAANHEYSFGFHRAEVLGAIASIFVIWLMTGILVYEAILRLITPVSLAQMAGCSLLA